MDVEARVAELRNLLGKELHSLGRITEDNRLVDVKLGEQGVQAVQLLSLL